MNWAFLSFIWNIMVGRERITTFRFIILLTIFDRIEINFAFKRILFYIRISTLCLIFSFERILIIIFLWSVIFCCKRVIWYPAFIYWLFPSELWLKRILSFKAWFFKRVWNFWFLWFCFRLLKFLHCSCYLIWGFKSVKSFWLLHIAWTLSFPFVLLYFLRLRLRFWLLLWFGLVLLFFKSWELWRLTFTFQGVVEEIVVLRFILNFSISCTFGKWDSLPSFDFLKELRVRILVLIFFLINSLRNLKLSKRLILFIILSFRHIIIKIKFIKWTLILIFLGYLTNLFFLFFLSNLIKFYLFFSYLLFTYLLTILLSIITLLILWCVELTHRISILLYLIYCNWVISTTAFTFICFV